ncbi:LacI family transcriptional regulator [Pullulanibacillus camelliae]|uniref:LacI family transcriptional regulator n=1 Tax=Pullulanibacillus camelliae TaxID=1707096 RepID=A0A8J2VJ20_9BACL|nr:LacI family DNA-binding transcriptional regulator [Pullulanibacillus camelliae]GGE31382.1 LacI family transcriptional regulator [Pullulanibacillus camelliae]
MVSIYDVAKHAGVSKSTVSRVLTGNSNVNKDTKQKVLDAIDELGYSPNASARALPMKKTNSIGIVLERLYDPFFSELIQGIGQQGEDSQYNLIYCDAKGLFDVKTRYIEYLTQGRVDGLVIFGSYITDESIIRKLSQRKFPFVLIENEFNFPTNSILLDNAGGALNATNHLIMLGHKKIAHITGNMNTKAALDRLNGYIQALQKQMIGVEGKYIAYNYGNNKFEEGYTSMQNLLALDELPTAVVGFDLIRSYGAVQAIYDAGLKIPDDIAFVSFDDQIFYDKRFNGPELTAIKLPLYEMGKESIKVLIDTIEKKTDRPVRKIFETDLIIRESCGALNQNKN